MDKVWPVILLGSSVALLIAYQVWNNSGMGNNIPDTAGGPTNGYEFKLSHELLS